MPWLLLALSMAAAAEPRLVDLTAVVPDAVLDVRYATAENFLKEPVYPKAAAYLGEPAAKKLAKAAQSLRAQGYRLVIHDAYRPFSVQKRMWALKPDRRYVADPARGGSHHNRGCAVDVSLAGEAGQLLKMPSDYDDFSERAHHSYQGGDAAARKRRDLLKAAMEAAGFKPLEEEWWHYYDPEGKTWPVMDRSFESFSRK